MVSLGAVKSQLLHRARIAGKTAGRLALNALMPPICPIADQHIATQGMVGPAGWSALHFVEAPYCRRCGVPFSTEYGEGVECPSCIAEPPAFDTARAAVVYDDASHDLVIGFKHADRTELAPMFAKWMIRAGQDLMTRCSILAPIPLHRQRLAARRFNQSSLLATAIGKQAHIKVAYGELQRVRATPPQQKLSAASRRRNMSGAFAVRRGAAATISGAHVILIDDVLTTGATLSSAARALKKAGARRVDALVLARVVKGGIGAI